MGKIVNYKKNVELLKEWWNSDLDIEIPTTKSKKNVLIFSADTGDNYWTKDGDWHFTGTRMLVPPDEEYRTKQWFKKMEPYFYQKFTLEEALNFLEEFNSN